MERSQMKQMPEDKNTFLVSKESLSLRQKTGQLFMPAVFINDTEEEVQKMEKLIQEHHIGSICFFHSRASAATNFEGKKKVVHNEKSLDRLKQLIYRYQKAAKIPLLIAMDAEWGLAMRIENTPQYPYAITLGASTNSISTLEEIGLRIGLDCKEAGINWNLAPVVDINNNPENPVIGYRSFGDDKNEVLSRASAFTEGMSKAGILNSIKHFPGHGDTATDSHLGLPVIDKSLQQLNENELFPFNGLIKKGVDSVMVGHLLVPQLDAEEPSTTSHIIITELLRNQLGFKGVIISDALNMHAVSKKYPEKGKLEATAFEAGMDVLCFSENVEEGIETILKTSSKVRIEESFERIWHLKEKVFLNKVSEKIHSTKNHQQLNRLAAEQSLTELYGNPDVVQDIKSSKFLNLWVGSPTQNLFSSKIHEEQRNEPWELTSSLIADEEKMKVSQNVVLAVFPPQVKPKGSFGFSSEQLELIKQLVQTKNVLLYLFGNPFALDLFDLDSTANAVMVYQDFEVFQEVAYQHFMGLLKASGRLPVKLKTFNP
ncbi:glycoside hydrolase family 3 protein [Flagellimonas nanhaiensis]|uniref:beta-N-acetylhexosaminidase n=1 Tax=Flagellimonas nanhaiensis TaxID=2292706 RepID=A0A371JTG5_9FLAO|nr:glycoside hydrolase family 3 protein [Allomuricauda nanhaiensis]RDY61094.1 glycoside hydrolase family 3 protein [Allomuricauda nanhaiensis]